MKNFTNQITLFLLFSGCTLFAQTPCSNGTAGGFPCNGMTLQGHLTIAQMGGTYYNSSNPAEATDSWGWTDATTGKEYAIVGMNDQTAFVDISNPIAPVYLGNLASHTSTSWWRDVKVYNDHAYIVSDNNGNHGMQIFDLTRLRNIPTTPATFNDDGWKTWGSGGNRGVAHNIVINEDTGFAYIIGTSGYANAGVVIFDLSNATNPSEVATISTYGRCHDAQTVTYNGPDTDYTGDEIMVASFDGSDFVRIINVTNKSNIQQISSFDYSNKSVTHQGWFTEDQRFFIVGDEGDETGMGIKTRTLVYDLQDLDNPVLIYSHEGATFAIDHNGYVKGNRFYLANYNAGLRVLKIDDLYNDANPSMTEVESFDTHPSTDGATFHGAWNVYPFFESGNIFISDLDEGLIIVRDPNYDTTPPTLSAQNINATLAHTGAVIVNAIDVDTGSTDNIGITSRKINNQDAITYTCDDLGDHVVTYRLEDDYGNVSTQDVTITVEARVTTWDGATWSGNNTPGPGSSATINAAYNTFDDGAINSCECQVTGAGTLTVAPESYIEIQKNITVNTNGALIVEHTGNVVQKDEDAVVINNGTINVKLDTPPLNARDFILSGSPMTAQNHTVYNNPAQLFKHTTENFDPYTGTPAVNGVNFLDNDINDWTPHTGVLNPGEGYLVRPSFTVDGSYSYVYDQGTLNSGLITYDAFYGSSKEDSPNQLSNPYASALNADMFIAQNAAVSEVYFWEHNITPSNAIPGPNSSNFSMQDVSMYNGTMGVAAASGGTTPNGVISTGQGFAIKANNPGGTVTFSNAMRLNAGNTTLRITEDVRDLLWISISEAEYEIGSTAGIGFLSAASDGYDTGYDSNRLGTIVSLYSHLEDGSEQLGIQGLRDFDVDREIPMGFETLIENDAHEYTISLENYEGGQLENVYVFILDNDTGISTNLSSASYKFTASNGVHNNRFTVYFRQKTFGIEGAPLEAILVYPNPVDTIFTIVSPLAQIENFSFYDTRGRRVINIVEQTNTSYTIDIANLESGIYYIEVVTDSGTVTKKIIKK